MAVPDVDRDLFRIGDTAWDAQIAGRDDGGESPFPASRVEPRERLVDRETRHHAGSGRHVTDLLREDAATLLLDQRGRVPGEDGILEPMPRGGPTIDFT